MQGGGKAATSPVVEYPTVCKLVLPDQANGKPNRNSFAPFHVYRDASGEQVSLQISVGGVTNLKLTGEKTVKIRKDKKSDIIKLCLDGYEFALIGDVPSVLADAPKRDSAQHDDGESIHLGDVELPFGERAKAAGGWQIATIPTNFTVGRVNGAMYGLILGGAYYSNTNGYYTAGTRPANKNTQWLSFQIKPVGLENAGEHVAISMMNYPYVSPFRIVGNGFIVGKNVGYPVSPPDLGGCGGAAASNKPEFNSQIESFWAQGNAVYADTCAGTAVPENVFTTFTAHVNVYQDIAYWRNGTIVATKNTATVRPYWHGAPLGTRPEATLDAGGILIGVTDFVSTLNFTVQFQSVSSGWF